MSGGAPGCPACGAAIRLSDGQSHAHCSACGALVLRRQPGPTVVIADESEAMCLEIAGVLRAEGFDCVRAQDGKQAVRLVRAERARGLVLNVGLPAGADAGPGLHSFAVIEQLRAAAATTGVRIVLLASVFNRTAYKRRPRTLYGADDYVEQHHIPDMLPAKLGALLGVEVGATLPKAMRAAIGRIESANTRDELGGAARVRAMAQAVVFDVALYHEQEVAEAVRQESDAPLAAALAEGRRILAELARGEPYPSLDPVGDAWRELRRTRGGRA